jgi:hypothetical protein
MVTETQEMASVAPPVGELILDFLSMFVFLLFFYPKTSDSFFSFSYSPDVIKLFTDVIYKGLY